MLYALIIKITQSRLVVNSQRIAHESTQVIKSLQEGLGGIRDVLIDGTQAAYCQIYRNADLPLRHAQGNNSFISMSPRYALEALGMLLISALAYMLALQPNGIAKAIPVLGVLALGIKEYFANYFLLEGGISALRIPAFFRLVHLSMVSSKHGEREAGKTTQTRMHLTKQTS